MLTTKIFETEQLTQRITRIRMPGDVFGYIVKGDERAAVIDTGCGLGPYRAFVEEQLGGMPYDLLLTHGHVDHAGAASQFDKVWMNTKDVPLAGEHTEKPIRANYLKRAFKEPFTDDDLAEPMKDGYTHMEYGQTFPLGGETLEIVNLCGHTLGSVGILFREERILLAGDACCSHTLMFGGGTSATVSQYRQTLIEAWDKYSSCFDTVIYSHPHNYGGPEVITQMIELCTEILEGKDDRIVRGMGNRVSYLAKAMGEGGRRADGKIANLSYSQDSLR